SRYLLTSSDVMPAMRQPVWNDDYGQLDGSFFYNINDNIQIGLQANNLTNSITKLLMGPRGSRRDGFIDETLYNRAWFENDRRYTLVMRASWSPDATGNAARLAARTSTSRLGNA